jgi:hypothetical protein
MTVAQSQLRAPSEESAPMWCVLSCGQQFTYDWEQLNRPAVADSISRSVMLRALAESIMATVVHGLLLYKRVLYMTE